MVRAVAIENAVWEDIRNLLLNPEQFNEHVEKALGKNKEKSKPVDEELSEIEIKISEKQSARGRIISMISKGIIGDKEAEATLKDLALEADSLIVRREFLFSKKDESVLLESEAITAQAMIQVFRDNFHTLDDAGKSRLVQILVRRINASTVIDEEGNRSIKAVMQYKINRSVELSLSGNVETHTTVCCLESTWVFEPFSRENGINIGWN